MDSVRERIAAMSLWRFYFAKRLIADGRLLLCFLVGLLLGQACSPLRNLEKNRLSRKTVTDSSLHVDRVWQSEEIGTSLRLESGRDSLDAEYTIQIWPKGPFAYDPFDGFSGEAEKIEVRGRQRRHSLRESADYNVQSKDLQVRTKLDVQQHSKSFEKQRAVKKTVSWKTILGYLLVAFCLAAAILLFRGIRAWRLG